MVNELNIVIIGFCISYTGQEVCPGIVEVVAAAIFELRSLGLAGFVERIGGDVLLARVALTYIIELLFVGLHRAAQAGVLEIQYGEQFRALENILAGLPDCKRLTGTGGIQVLIVRHPFGGILLFGVAGEDDEFLPVHAFLQNRNGILHQGCIHSVVEEIQGGAVLAAAIGIHEEGTVFGQIEIIQTNMDIFTLGHKLIQMLLINYIMI